MIAFNHGKDGTVQVVNERKEVGHIHATILKDGSAGFQYRPKGVWKASGWGTVFPTFAACQKDVLGDE